MNTMRRPRYFQWLDGDAVGVVEILENITTVDGEYFYNFRSGESCNLRYISQMTNSPAQLKGKVMVEIANSTDPWKVSTIGTHKEKVIDDSGAEVFVDVPPIEDITGASGNGNNLNLDNSTLGSKKFYPPKYRGQMWELPSYEEYGCDDSYETLSSYQQPSTRNVTASSPAISDTVTSPAAKVSISKSTPAPKIAQVSDSDPVRILAKTCKKHSTDVNLTVSINLPSKSIYNIAKAEFENGGKNFIDCLVEELDVNMIIQSLAKGLLDAYETSDE